MLLAVVTVSSICKYNTKSTSRYHLTKEAIPIKKLLNDAEISDNDLCLIFETAISNYENEFSNYLDITALNVSDSEAINLVDYDSDYVAPYFYDVMYEYQCTLENSLTIEETNRYENLKSNNYLFDRYVSLNSVLYSNLSPQLFYEHDGIPTNPMVPITPNHPFIIYDFDHINRIASSTSGIITILSSAGLAESIIAAFTACISTMTTGLSTSWIPYVGWALAIALIVGALIALVVIIVENWEAISAVLNDIKNWFLQEFSRFSSYINSFFESAIAKGNESLISSRVMIGDREFEFSEVKSNDEAKQADIVWSLRRTYDVLLMQYVNSNSFQIAIGMPVTKQFCIQYRTHYNGFSSYTWYQNNARSLIIQAGTGYTTLDPELHLLIQNYNTHSRFAFKHFHNCDANGVKCNSAIQGRTHSFFGLLYWTENMDGEGSVSPLSPTN